MQGAGTAYSFRAGIVLLAAAGALAPLPAAAVDRWYSAGLYATLQPMLTSLSNLAPFALFDGLVALVAIAWLALAARDLRRPEAPLRRGLRIATRTIVWSAGWYLVFLACWGLNYRRPRLRDTRAYDASAVTSTAAAAASRLAVTRLNALYETAHAAGLPDAGAIDPALAAGFARALHDTGIAREVVPARPKHTRSIGISAAPALTG